MIRPTPQRGQTLVLLALAMVLLVLMSMMTLSIASRIRDRIELQTLADTSAYSNAVATARSFNNAALLNRAMISQWSSMCGIATLHAWGSMQNAYFHAFGAGVLEMNDANPNIQWGSQYPGHNSPDDGTCLDGNGYFACSGRWTVDPNPNANDCDGIRRQELAAEAATLFAQGDTAFARNFGGLDSQVITQVQNLWQSMDDLGRIQIATQNNLTNVLQQQTYAQQLVALSGIKESVTVHSGGPPQNVALREVQAAAPVGIAPNGDQAPDAHRRAMAQALMGSRGDPFYFQQYHPPRAFTNWMTVSGRGNGVQHPLGNGAWVRYTWPTFTRNTSHPGSYCQNDKCPSSQSNRSQPQYTPNTNFEQYNDNPNDDNQMDELYTGNSGTPDEGGPISPGINTPWRGPALTADWSGLYGGAWAGDLHVEYHEPNTAPNGAVCTFDQRKNTIEAMSFVWYTVPNGPEVPRHYTTGHHPFFDEIGPGHHPGELQSNQHIAGNANTKASLLPFQVGFAFPSLGEKGAGGAWGQPKTPVMLHRNLTHKDPWNLLTGMKFSGGGPGAELDLQKGFTGPVAVGNAIAYYHRTSTTNGGGAWVEAPSFLNPFWRATLVPLDIDEHPAGNGFGEDNTPTYTAPTAAQADAVTLLSTLPAPQNELKAYQKLTAAGYKGGQ